MIKVKINQTQLNTTLKNIVEYSDGFLKGIDMKK